MDQLLSLASPSATTVDFSNFYNYTSCFLLTACSSDVENPAQVLDASGAPATQPRLTDTVFYAMSKGNSYMTQQNYIDAYYNQISITPGGSYPDDVTYILINGWPSLLGPVSAPPETFLTQALLTGLSIHLSLEYAPQWHRATLP